MPLEQPPRRSTTEEVPTEFADQETVLVRTEDARSQEQAAQSPDKTARQKRVEAALAEQERRLAEAKAQAERIIAPFVQEATKRLADNGGFPAADVIQGLRNRIASGEQTLPEHPMSADSAVREQLICDQRDADGAFPLDSLGSSHMALEQYAKVREGVGQVHAELGEHPSERLKGEHSPVYAAIVDAALPLFVDHASRRGNFSHAGEITLFANTPVQMPEAGRKIVARTQEVQDRIAKAAGLRVDQIRKRDGAAPDQNRLQSAQAFFELLQGKIDLKTMVERCIGTEQNDDRRFEAGLFAMQMLRELSNTDGFTEQYPHLREDMVRDAINSVRADVHRDVETGRIQRYLTREDPKRQVDNVESDMIQSTFKETVQPGIVKAQMEMQAQQQERDAKREGLNQQQQQLEAEKASVTAQLQKRFVMPWTRRSLEARQKEIDKELAAVQQQLADLEG